MSGEEFDLVVIGSGPGGYTGAIRAAQLGLKTAVIEKDPTFGGTCLNVGCIPSKALLDSSEYFAFARHDAKEHGIVSESVQLDLKTMMKRKDKIVSDLTGGIAFLFKKNKITPYVGTGKITGANQVEVTGSDGKKTTLSAKNIMIASGSVPVELPHIQFDGKKVISSTEALKLPKVPKHLVVIGAGAIGLEMGSVWLRLGAKVTVIEAMNKICGAMDAQMSKELQKVLTKQGMEFLIGAKVTGAETKGSEVALTVEGADVSEIKGDVVLVAVGRKPYAEGLGLSDVRVALTDRGRIQVNEKFQTSVSNIYAIGDVIDGPMLAHKAEEEGVAVAEIVAGHAAFVNYLTVPGVIYTWPELASVGYTEEQLKEKGIAYNKGTFPFMANARAKAIGETNGMVKFLADKTTDKILGCHILGPRASDVLAEAVLAMEFSASSEDVGKAFHGHPTLSEVVREAALAVRKQARQM